MSDIKLREDIQEFLDDLKEDHEIQSSYVDRNPTDIYQAKCLKIIEKRIAILDRVLKENF